MVLRGTEERVQEENLRTLEPRKDAALFLAPARVGHRCCEGSLRCCLLSCPCLRARHAANETSAFPWTESPGPVVLRAMA